MKHPAPFIPGTRSTAMIKRTSCCILLISLLLFSCKKEDKTAPIIQAVMLNDEQLIDIDTIQAGSVIDVDLLMTDDIELQESRLNIHANADGHIHDDDEVLASAEGEWEETILSPLVDKNLQVSHSLNAPTTVRGEWHLEASCIDASGNLSDVFRAQLIIENEYLPVIDIEGGNPAPDTSGVFSVTGGTNFNFLGSATDDSGIDTVRFELYDFLYDTLILQQNFLPASTTWNLDQGVIAVPDSSARATTLTVRVTDTEGYFTEQSRTLLITD